MKTKSKGLGIFFSVLAVGLAVAIGIGSSGFTNWNVKAWFNHWGKGEQAERKEPEVLGTIGEGMIMPEKSGTEEDAVSFMSAVLPRSAYAANAVSEEAEKAYTVTATVLPDNDAENTAVEWSAKWKSGRFLYDAYNGYYVTETDSYIEITPSGESVAESKIVSVSCLRSFGEPIILTATCKNAPEISASIQIDYAMRVSFFYPRSDSSEYPNRDAEGTSAILSFGSDSSFTFEFGSGVSCQNLYIRGLNYQISGYYTVTDEYDFKWKYDSDRRRIPEFTPYPYGDIFTTDSGETYSFTFKNTTDFGKKVLEDIAAGRTGYVDLSPSSVNDPSYYLLYLNTTRMGSHMSRPGVGENGAARATLKYDIESGHITRAAAANAMRKELNDSGGKLYFGTLTLEITGSRATYCFSTNVYITKVLYSTAISGVEIDGPGILL